MRRRHLIGLIAIAAVMRPSCALAQSSSKRPLIAALFGSAPEVAAPAKADFLEGMAALGHVEGQSFDLVDRYAGGRVERLAGLADELVRLAADVVLTGSMAATLAVKKATSTVPIVSASLTDPVGAGLAASQARPGGQVTGFLWTIETLPAKQLELLLAMVPQATRIGMLVNAGNLTVQHAVQAAAVELGIELILAEVSSPDHLAEAIEGLKRERVQGLLVLGSAIFVSEKHRLVALVTAARLPALYAWREIAEAGGLMSYGVNLRESFRHASFHVVKILRGMKPGDIPLELPPRFDFVINLQAARAIGLTMPETLLVQTPEVIE
jgi:putative tryptophan/tyrosine transport system substrate-binding protein